jgi:hypothetical protein
MEFEAVCNVVNDAFTKYDTDNSGVLEKPEARKFLIECVTGQGLPEPSDADIDEAF